MFSSGFDKTAKEKLKGGKGDNMPDKCFDKKELKEGQKHEGEHTKNKAVRKEIAKDHLAEDPKYYEHLKKMEKNAETAADKIRAIGNLGRQKKKMEKKASIFDKVLKKPTKSEEVLKHLKKYRRDYMMATGVSGTLASAHAAHKNVKLKEKK